MLKFIRNFLADQPAFFSLLRKIIEVDFSKQKQIIRKIFDFNNSKKILDIGCGTGEFADLFSKFDYYGIDISATYIRYAAKRKRGSFKTMDATKLEFSDDSFDYILIMAILHHLDDNKINGVLSEAKRVLKPGGKILVMEDAKIEKLENLVIKFFQKFDKGDFIRTPEQYKNIIAKYFNVTYEQSFRNGGCVYYCLALEK